MVLPLQDLNRHLPRFQLLRVGRTIPGLARKLADLRLIRWLVIIPFEGLIDLPYVGVRPGCFSEVHHLPLCFRQRNSFALRLKSDPRDEVTFCLLA